MPRKKDNTKDGRFVTTNAVNAPDGPEVKDPVKEGFLRQNEFLVLKREKEEMLRLAELDVKRTYQTAQQLFVNACDYLKNTIVPVHGNHEILGPYSKLLEEWIDILVEWADGIPIGKEAEWDVILERINEIKRETKRLNESQAEIKEKEINKRKDELKKINDELAKL